MNADTLPSSAVAEDPVLDNASIGDFLDQHAETLLPALLPAYLGRQRWFGSKSRTIASAIPSSVLPVEGANAVLTVIDVTYAEGASESYQLPLAITTGEAASRLQTDSPNAILHTFQTPEGLAILHDATLDADFRGALLAMTEDSGEWTASSRVASAEQSNTSIIYGSRAILKLYRRLQSGENPDVEISRFLTQQTDFRSIPAYLGQLGSAEGATLAFLQAFAPNQGDGWEWMQAKLLALFTEMSQGEEPAPPAGELASFLRASSTPQPVAARAAETLAAAALLGRRTAELHLALATETSDPAFSAVPFTPNDLAADSTRIRTQISKALDALKSRLGQVPADVRDKVAQLLGKRSQLMESANRLATASPFRSGLRIRVHGDYHLGQVLRTTNDFLIVDFEGEPARPLEERRQKQSPLRDVAGMLRSFSYAAYAALDAYKNEAPQQGLLAWAKAWEQAASSTFLGTYRDTIAAANPELLPQPEQAQAALVALLLEKATYELLYELNNRPAWLSIPLDGILSLLHEAA